jgi:hypothetical protein
MSVKSVAFVNKFTTMLGSLLRIAKAGGKPVVFEEVTIAANGTKDYNLTTLIPDHATYDLKTARVTAWVLDEQAGSDTNGYYITAEAFVVAGFTAAGAIRVRLARDTATKVLIRVDRPFKKK